MKECELCNSRARMYCESDQARLCWDCDSKVHSANFIVARHTRILLCDVCQSPTPWRASGRILGPTASICHSCARNCDRSGIGRKEEKIEEAIDDSDEEMESSEDDNEEDFEDDDDEDCENQVVPWASTPPPAASSSTSSDDSSRGDFFGRFSRNRMCQDDEIYGSSAQSSSEDYKTPNEIVVSRPIRSNRDGFGRSSMDHHARNHR